jgi:protein tyrosine phosphatase (PTP) superfamily phosphohydrolase (DUF442 family)
MTSMVINGVLSFGSLILWALGGFAGPLALAESQQQASASAPATSSYGLPNESHPVDGWIFSGQPSAEALAELVRDGYRVLDLRTVEENRGLDEAAVLSALGGAYTNVPVSPQRLREDPAVFEQVFAELERAGDQPLLVHCATSNRVGALYYAWLVARRGENKTRALEQARAAGLSSDALVGLVDAWLESTATQ